MAHTLFLSYRRSDAAQAAQGLWAQLRARFGHSRVFMDVGTIEPGERWPDRLRGAVDASSVLLALIGPLWLKAADRHGRRRLDDPQDWVRTELLRALELGKTVIPVLVAGATVPEPEALPSELRSLDTSQAICLGDDSWDRDVNELIRVLVERHGFVDNTTRVETPTPEVTIPALSAAELEAALVTLRGWEPVESSVPGDYPKTRQELRKVYRFGSFKKAMAFMQAAVPPVQTLQHHPRWENQWRTVTVHLTTWDIGNRISAIDVEVAKALDGVYEQLRRKSSVAPRPAP